MSAGTHPGDQFPSGSPGPNLIAIGALADRVFGVDDAYKLRMRERLEALVDAEMRELASGQWDKNVFEKRRELRAELRAEVVGQASDRVAYAREMAAIVAKTFVSATKVESAERERFRLPAGLMSEAMAKR